MESLTRLKREAEKIPSVMDANIERDEFGNHVQVEAEDNALDELDQFCEEHGDVTFKPDGKLLGRYYYVLR
jgi:hypothetical protein